MPYAIWMWPKLLLFVSCVYCVLPMIYFIFNKRRKRISWSSSFDRSDMSAAILELSSELICSVLCLFDFSHEIDDLFDFVHQ